MWLLVLHVLLLSSVIDAAITDCITADGRQGSCAIFFSCNTDAAEANRSPCMSYGKCCPTNKTASVNATSEAGCGQLGNIAYIVGGYEVQPVNHFPWQVALFQRNGNRSSFFCGGSVIRESWILTAAHCVNRMDIGKVSPDILQVLVGTNDLKTGGELVNVSKVIPHEDYRPWRVYDDIALLKLSQPLTYNDNIAPVCLSTPDMVKSRLDGQELTVSGWGTTSQNGKISTKLLQVQVYGVPEKKCEDAYVKGPADMFQMSRGINDNFICAGVNGGGKDSCQGDSGGPLVLINGTTAMQVGVVSFGNGCAQADYPGVYTNVNHYLPWMGNRMAAN